MAHTQEQLEAATSSEHVEIFNTLVEDAIELGIETKQVKKFKSREQAVEKIMELEAAIADAKKAAKKAAKKKTAPEAEARPKAENRKAAAEKIAAEAKKAAPELAAAATEAKLEAAMARAEGKTAAKKTTAKAEPAARRGRESEHAHKTITMVEGASLKEIFREGTSNFDYMAAIAKKAKKGVTYNDLVGTEFNTHTRDGEEIVRKVDGNAIMIAIKKGLVVMSKK